MSSIIRKNYVGILDSLQESLGVNIFFSGVPEINLHGVTLHKVSISNTESEERLRFSMIVDNLDIRFSLLSVLLNKIERCSVVIYNSTLSASSFSAIILGQDTASSQLIKEISFKNVLFEDIPFVGSVLSKNLSLNYTNSDWEFLGELSTADDVTYTLKMLYSAVTKGIKSLSLRSDNINMMFNIQDQSIDMDIDIPSLKVLMEGFDSKIMLSDAYDDRLKVKFSSSMVDQVLTIDDFSAESNYLNFNSVLKLNDNNQSIIHVTIDKILVNQSSVQAYTLLLEILRYFWFSSNTMSGNAFSGMIIDIQKINSNDVAVSGIIDIQEDGTPVINRFYGNFIGGNFSVSNHDISYGQILNQLITGHINCQGENLFVFLNNLFGIDVTRYSNVFGGVNFDVQTDISLSERLLIIKGLQANIGKMKMKLDMRAQQFGERYKVYVVLRADYLHINDLTMLREIIENLSLQHSYFDTEITLEIHNIILENNVIDSFGTVISVDKIGMKLRNFTVLSPSYTVKGMLFLENTGIVPFISCRFEFSGVELSSIMFWRSLIPYTLYKDHITWQQDTFKYIDGDLFTSISGSIGIQFRSIMRDENIIIDEANVQLTKRKKIVTIEEFNIEKSNSLFTVKGEVIFDNVPSVKLSLSVDNFPVWQLMKYLFGVQVISVGRVSFVGAIVTKGRSFSYMARNIGGNIKLIGKKLLVSGMSFQELISGLMKIQNNRDVETLLNIDVFNESMLIEDIDLEFKMDSGILEGKGNMRTEYTNSIIILKLILENMNTNTLVRIFFNLGGNVGVTYLDLIIAGLIWNPKIYFDNKNALAILQTRNEASGYVQ
ncbi:MAG: hypothetical protein P857_14 [Candidatus Xenolissoclinum pacificiensis L6]|uniref:Uncharacterized protein n=1 Tax=Candidatus Xenolissoclinum pacificiensis L6 TaxID=1401685 RepID=W2V1N4_9RICK|nr:MAG: hypothetical protein P857_14 [Candidatus Xenolissoclinum pacificiensis L6]